MNNGKVELWNGNVQQWTRINGNKQASETIDVIMMAGFRMRRVIGKNVAFSLDFALEN